MKASSPSLTLENAVNETEALLKLIGEAHEATVVMDHNAPSAAAGMQQLRRDTIDRLRESATAVMSERFELEREVKRLRKLVPAPAAPPSA